MENQPKNEHAPGIRELIASDSYAVSFQSMGQYRSALLKALDTQTAQAAAPATAEMLDMLGRIDPFTMPKEGRDQWFERLSRARAMQQPLPVPNGAVVIWHTDLVWAVAELIQLRAYRDLRRGQDTRRVGSELQSAPVSAPGLAGQHSEKAAAANAAGLPGCQRGIATVTMNGHQLREALEFINPDGDDDTDQLDDELTFGIVQHKDDDGKVSTGLCCWNDDTDGVYPLDGEPSPRPTAEKAGGLTLTDDDICAFQHAIQQLEWIASGTTPDRNCDLGYGPNKATVRHAMMHADSALKRLKPAYARLLDVFREDRRTNRAAAADAGGQS